MCRKRDALPILFSAALFQSTAFAVSGLAQGGFLKDPAFIKYLKYLQYWQQPAYAKYIIYPHCLFFLDCLQNQDFRTAMARNEIKEMVHTQQLLFWQHRSNRQAANADEAQGDTDNVANGQGS